MKAFPPAEEGMTRNVIRLPQQKDESVFKVEVIVGKMVRTDAVNRYFFGGILEKETIPGGVSIVTSFANSARWQVP